MDVSLRQRRVRRVLSPLITGLIAGSCTVALLGGCSDGTQANSGPTAETTAPAARIDSDLEKAYKNVIKNVLPSVVQIEAGEGLGSGVVYDNRGHIVTNAHVVGREKDFKVTVATDKAPLAAVLVATYPEQDLAVIKLDKVPNGLKAAEFGDSSKVEVGHIVLAMGSPFGLSSSVTQGIVSAVGRTVSEPPLDDRPGATIANMVQTSAAINPGNSGGALVNLDSEVIGIPTLGATDPKLGEAAAGIGFAIPSSMVRTVADQIIKDGRVTDSGRAALGVRARTVLDDEYEPSGVAVVEVAKGGAAEKAGIEIGDIITGLGDDEITTITSLAESLASDKPGQRIKVTYERGGEERTVEVTLGEI
ncbi:trypsin-like peptidase domain-containing protein [Streptomyces sp. NPDC000410]|uniref:S1C family serine protease n=1 Tax=Streptomyces sp. NPDC000410 TaxID=3154254 RepID=UPI00331A61A5